MDTQELTKLRERLQAGDLEADRQLTMLAASGDHGAQREVLTVLLGWCGGTPTTFGQAVRLEMLARFCSIRGDAYDAARHAQILWAAAKFAREEDCSVEHINSVAEECAGILFRLSEAGWGPASDNLAGFAKEFPEAWAKAEAEAKAAPKPDLPPMIVRIAEPTLGDILAEVFEQQAAPAQGWFAPVRAFLDDWRWRNSFAVDVLMGRVN